MGNQWPEIVLSHSYAALSFCCKTEASLYFERPLSFEGYFSVQSYYAPIDCWKAPERHLFKLLTHDAFHRIHQPCLVLLGCGEFEASELCCTFAEGTNSVALFSCNWFTTSSSILFGRTLVRGTARYLDFGIAANSHEETSSLRYGVCMAFMAKSSALLQMSFHTTLLKPGVRSTVGVDPYHLISIVDTTREQDGIFSVMENPNAQLLELSSRRTLFYTALYSRVRRHW